MRNAEGFPAVVRFWIIVTLSACIWSAIFWAIRAVLS